MTVTLRGSTRNNNSGSEIRFSTAPRSPQGYYGPESRRNTKSVLKSAA